MVLVAGPMEAVQKVSAELMLAMEVLALLAMPRIILVVEAVVVHPILPEDLAAQEL
jgi:hypothetical protein